MAEKDAVSLIEQLSPSTICYVLGKKSGYSLLSIFSKNGKLGTIPYTKIPRINSVPLIKQYPEIVSPDIEKVGRVLYFVGCATNYLFEDVGRSVVTVLTRLGVEVVIPKKQMCCGLPIFMSGARDTALNNIQTNLRIFSEGNFDAVIVDCATCGSALKKEYTHILEEMGQDTKEAEALASKVLDISEYLSRFVAAALRLGTHGSWPDHRWIQSLYLRSWLASPTTPSIPCESSTIVFGVPTRRRSEVVSTVF